jgi:cellulose synthase/poly-beta-1,6-N-acetylglucosamine synthase-like glycosyltransferase
VKSRKWILTACVAVPAYAYAGYPVLIRCIGALRARPVHKAAICPPLSIIIAAHNEAAALPRKLDSLFEQYYPLENLEVIIASDGSTDGTGRVADAYAQRGIQMVTLDLERGGKARALNRAVAERKLNARPRFG